jgi:hypothetical protein
VVIELGSVVGLEAARAYVPERAWNASVGEVYVGLAVCADVVVPGEHEAGVVAELVGLVARESARAVKATHRS